MNILIVDDLPIKISRLITLLVDECQLHRNDIRVVQNAMDARVALKDTAFDLCIMDIVLPMRAEDDPSREVSLELLQELEESDAYVRPSHILGLTAYAAELQATEPYFSQKFWKLIEFDASRTDWCKPIVSCVQYIKSNSQKPSQNYLIDLAVITALDDPEMAAVHELPWDWQPPAPLDDMTFGRRANLTIDGRAFTVVTAAAPRMGMIATALLAAKIIELYRPRVLAMTGICAGVKEKTELGDIIFADNTWDWQSGKRIKNKENSQFAIDPHHLPASEFLRVRAMQLRGDRVLWAKVKTDWPTPPTQELRFHVGPLASGSAVLADGQTVTEIKNQQRTLLGVEMEAYGLFAAAMSASGPKPLPIAIKSVCDFADPDKHDAMQAYAAFTSAQALNVLMQRFLPSLVDASSSAR